MPDISVILPVYNAERFVGEAVTSILRQTCADFELICIDDGSTDGSGSVLAAFADDSRVTVVTQENRGLVATLNRALGLAAGRYIARMDADDVADERRLEKQVRFLAARPDVGVVGTCAWTIDESGNRRGFFPVPLGRRATCRKLAVGSPFIHPSVMARSEVFERLGGYPDVRHAEDYALWTAASAFGMANFPEPLLLYRHHGKSVSRENAGTQSINHRRVRAAHWARRPPEPDAPRAWSVDVAALLAEEREAAGDADVAPFLRDLFYNRVAEANLAYFAGRPDIGLRCLFELRHFAAHLEPDIASPKAVWPVVYRTARLTGFRAAWRLFRTAAAPFFRRTAKRNPLFSW